MQTFNAGNLVLSLFCLFIFVVQIACQTQSQPSTANVSDLNDNSQASKSLNNGGVQTSNDGPPPVSISRVTKREGKPPLQIYSFETEFKSRRDSYTWLLFSKHIDVPLPESGTFDSDGSFEIPIETVDYLGKKHGRVVEVRFYGKDDFRAIRLPLTGPIKFNTFVLTSDSDVSALEVWEVRSLSVNGKIPIEEWLPYDTTSDAPDISLDSQRDLRSLESNSNTKQLDSSKEEVKFVIAQGIRKWRIPFNVSIDKK